MIDSKTLFDIVDFRDELYINFLKGKVSMESFANRSYFYFKQLRLRHVKKAHDLESIVFNYLYWTANIERRVYLERELIKLESGSAERLNEIISNYIKRRNQMVRRILYEFDEFIEIESMKIVYEDLVELKFKQFKIPFYCNKEALDKIKINVTKIENSRFEEYLPFIIFKIKLKID